MASQVNVPGGGDGTASARNHQQQKCACRSVPKDTGSADSSSSSSSSRDSDSSSRKSNRRLAVFASSALCFVFLAALYDESVTTAARSSLGIWENAHSFWQQKDSSGKKIKKTHAAAFKRNLAGDDAYQANNNGDDQANNNGDDQAANNNYNDDQAANNNNDDQAANNDDLNQNYGYGNDDGAPDADDYFYDYFTDDYASDDTTIDDFYAFEQEDRAPRLFPLTPRVLLGYMIAAMALTLGASGGIGGGGIIVPVFILIMGLQPKVAIPIGAATVLGGSIGSTLMNFSRRHPLADRPIIDWDLVLVMEPLTLVGALLGTKFHSLFSEKFLVVLLVLLLSFTAHATLTKAMRMYDAEKRYIRHLKAAQSEPPNGSPIQSLTWGPDVEERSKDQSSWHMDTVERQQILILNPDFVTVRSELVHEEKFTPRSKIGAVVWMFSVLIFLNIMVGGGAYKSPWDITCGSVAFWVVQVIMIAFLIASAWAAQTYLVARHEIKEYVRFDYVHGDIKWDARSAIIYPAVFIAAGLFAGMFGIGGGIITVPIMLAMGVHPSVVSATSSAMILFTACTSCTSYIIFGLLLWDYAITGFVIGFFAAIAGQKMMKHARQAKSASGRDFERNSYIAFVIGGVVLVSALLMTIQYVFMIVDEPDGDVGLCDGLQF